MRQSNYAQNPLRHFMANPDPPELTAARPQWQVYGGIMFGPGDVPSQDDRWVLAIMTADAHHGVRIRLDDARRLFQVEQ